MSILTLLLTAAITVALDPQSKAEVDELITFGLTSGVRSIRNGIVEGYDYDAVASSKNPPRADGLGRAAPLKIASDL